jgi:hypothetical protein
MKILTSSFVLLISLSAFAQAPDRFIQNYFFPPNSSSQSYGVANTNYGYMLAGMSIDSAGAWGYTVSGVDSMGNFLWYKRYQMASNQNMCIGWFIQDFLKKSDETYYSTFYTHDIGTENYTSYLIKLDDQGDTLWTKHLLGDSIDQTLETRSVSKTKDGGFLISGLTGPFMGDTKCFLMKTDSLGNTQWKQKYNFNTQNEVENVFTAIEDTVTNKIVMVGYRNNQNKSFVCILDSTGTILQQKYFNSPDGGWLFNVKQLPDGNFIAVGSEFTGNTVGSFDMQKPMTIKFDINGNLIWKNVTGHESISNSFHSTIIEDDNSILSVGFMDTLFTLNMGINTMLCIEKTSFSGNVIFRRIINIFDLHSSGEYQTIIKSDFGGYATVAYNSIGSAPNPFVLVKLDEWACLSEGCQTAGVDEVNNDFLVNIFPNPANENLIVSLPENSFNTTCVLFDNLGKEVANFSVSAGDNNLNIKELKSGMYTIQVHSQKIKFIKN